MIQHKPDGRPTVERKSKYRSRAICCEQIPKISSNYRPSTQYSQWPAPNIQQKKKSMILVKEDLVEMICRSWLGYQGFRIFSKEDQKLLQKVSFFIYFSIQIISKTFMD